MLCPGCGKKSKGLCTDCYLDENPIHVGKVKVSFCSCGRLRYRSSWNPTLKDIQNAVRKNIKSPSDVRLSKIRVKSDIKEGNLYLAIVVEGKYKNGKFKREIDTKTKLQISTCPTCSRKSSGYYEAILQFRCKMPEVQIKEDRITKVEKVRGGFDYYVMSNNYAKSIAFQLKKRDFKIKVSKKIYGKRDGREIYRVNYSIKEK